MAIKQAQDTNKQKLAQYTWQETETISIKGSVKDTKIYQVQMVNGQQQKNPLSDQKAQSGGHEGRMKERMIEKKTEEYEQYGQQISALAKQYTTPNPQLLMQAKQAGNISVQPGAGTVSLVIKNYIKPGDSVTMTISEQTHSPVSVSHGCREELELSEDVIDCYSCDTIGGGISVGPCPRPVGEKMND